MTHRRCGDLSHVTARPPFGSIQDAACDSAFRVCAGFLLEVPAREHALYYFYIDYNNILLHYRAPVICAIAYGAAGKRCAVTKPSDLTIL